MAWVPTEACTLPTDEQPLRVAEFDQLFADSLVCVERHGAGQISLLLDDEQSVLETAQDLADRETSCCSFFGFAVRRTDRGVEMRIDVPPARTAILFALAEHAEAILAGGRR